VSYSSDEKSAAVGSLVQGTLSFQQDSLGPLDTATEFTEIMEIVYSVLLYDPDVVFYLIYLARNGIKQIINAEDALCDDLLDAIDDLAMPNRPVNDVSSIASARNSLQAMDSSLSRSGSLAGSEYRRYQQALTRAKRELSRTVKMTFVPRGSTAPVTDIVRPSGEAKVDVSTSFASLKDEHTRLLSSVGSIQSALSEFTSGKLSSRVGQRQVLRAFSQLDDLYEVLEGLTGEERILQARQALLTLLANESVVKALATLPIPGTAKFSQLVSSDPLYRLTAHGEGTAPVATGTISAPYPLYDSAALLPTNLLSFSDLNGSPLVADLFPVSSPSYHSGIKAATVMGSVAGDFAIGPDLVVPWPLVSKVGDFTIAAGTEMFHIAVDGTHYECELNTGTRTGAQIQTDLDNVAMWTDSIRPEITVTVTGANEVSIAYSVVSPPTSYAQRSMVVTNGFSYASGLAPWYSGDGGSTPATRSTGWDGNSEIWIKANDDPAFVAVDLPEGDWPDYLVPAGPVGTVDTVAYAIDDAGGAGFTASTSGDRVSITSELDGEGSIITILGDVAGTPSARCLSTIGLTRHQESREADVSGAALVNMLNNDSTFSVDAVARMLRQDVLNSGRAVRDSDTVLSIPVTADPTGDWPAFAELKVNVASGDNRGAYQLAGYAWNSGASSVELTLSRRLRDNTADLMHTVVVYHEVLEITSLDAGLTGVVELDHPTDSARDLLGLDGITHTAMVNELELEYRDPVYGWRALDVSRLHIRVGDLVLDGISAEQATITSTAQLGDGVLVVSPSLDPSFALSVEGFSIQSGAFVMYQTFIDTLDLWVAGTLPPFGEDLSWIDRALGPILLVTPSRDRVNTAYTRVSMLKSKLADLTTILDAFFVSAIAAADSALQALLEHGFDRARQMLITGEFTTFFAATAGNASFSKAFQAAANEFVVQDVNRGSRAKARFDSEFVRLRQSWEEDKHPDYDFSDFEEEPPEDTMIDYYHGVNEREGT